MITLKSANCLVAGTLVMLMLGGFFIRVQRLRGVDGTLGEDQARMALAATGIVETGLPTMPSGRIYLRGLTSSYLTAASLAIFGRNDFAARLPNAIIGTLCIPLLFAFGNALAGIPAGLSLALFATVHPDLVHWSTDAWTTLPFVVIFVAATYFLYHGYERDRAAMQVAGGIASVIAVLTHELGVLLAIAVGVHLVIRRVRNDVAWFHGRSSLTALALLAATIVIFVGFGLALRMGTVAGASAEFKAYFGPSLTIEKFLVDFERWRSGYLPLVLAAALGLPFLWRAPFAGGLFLYVTTAVVGSTVWFILSKTSERYGLVLLPLIALLAAWALDKLAGRIVKRWPGRLLGSRQLAPFLIVAVFTMVLQKDVRAVTEQPEPPSRTWLTELRALGWNPGDIMFSDNPSIPAFYLGRVDYWARQGAFARYSYTSGDHLRDVYAGAVRVATEDDFASLMTASQGKTLWYVGEERKVASRLVPAVQEGLFRSAQEIRRTPDGVVILRVDLNDPGLLEPQ